jgi:hypothetical protein
MQYQINFPNMKPQILLRSILLITLIFPRHSGFGQSLARTETILAANCTRLQNQGVTIATAADGRLRIYSWDGQTGGTAHNANNVYQYIVNDKVYSSGLIGTLGFEYILDSEGNANFNFNPASGTITFPVVLENGHVTKSKIIYTFNGNYFERTKN